MMMETCQKDSGFELLQQFELHYDSHGFQYSGENLQSVSLC